MSRLAPLGSAISHRAQLDALRTELADLAYALERQGRVDAADVVMQIDTRVRELAEDAAVESTDTPFSL